MFGLGPTELLLILGVVLVLFGGKKLPQLGTGLGEGIRSFRDALKGVNEDETKSLPAPRADMPHDNEVKTL